MKEDLPDEKIMLLVQTGQLSELTELFNRYHVRLYNYFLKLTFDEMLSEDLTQNLFYRIIKYNKSYQNENGSFRSWLYSVARNVHRDNCKQEKRNPNQYKSLDSTSENIEANQEGYTENEYIKLDKALSKLKADQREILVLSRFQGLKYDEISKIKQISVASIKVQVHRAIKELRIYYFQNVQD